MKCLHQHLVVVEVALALQCMRDQHMTCWSFLCGSGTSWGSGAVCMVAPGRPEQA